MPKSQRSRKQLEKQLDKLWRERGANYCEICDKLPLSERVDYTKLDTHHIVGRTNKLLRWDLRNQLKVCPTLHTLGGSGKTVQDNLGGWFLNWESDNDWMGKWRKEDKEYLRERYKIPYKQWTISELEEMVIKLKEK